MNEVPETDKENGQDVESASLSEPVLNESLLEFGNKMTSSELTKSIFLLTFTYLTDCH